MTASPRGRHPTTRLLTCCGYMAPIDVEIVPVTALWEGGIHTNFCCQGDPGGTAQVMFPLPSEADRFALFVSTGWGSDDPANMWANWRGFTDEGWTWRMCVASAQPLQIEVRFPHEQLAPVATARSAPRPRPRSCSRNRLPAALSGPWCANRARPRSGGSSALAATSPPSAGPWCGQGAASWTSTCSLPPSGFSSRRRRPSMRDERLVDYRVLDPATATD